MKQNQQGRNFTKKGLVQTRFEYAVHSFVLLCFFQVFIPLASHAQQLEMKLAFLAPDWNQTTVCDPGTGYQPTPINAPSINYSGAVVGNSLYNYSWEQRKNNEDWQVVATASNSISVRSYRPSPLRGNKDGTTTKYSWRLKVTDTRNIL
jgi:hypothetical protein